jgi:dihydrofolate reductase
MLLKNSIIYRNRSIDRFGGIFSLPGAKNIVKMRKVILLMHMSLDGFVSGKNGEMNWITIDDEIFKDANELSNTADIALYGRKTYQMMASYWPSVLTNANSTPLELEHARWMEEVTKIVFSTTLEKVEWNNARLIKRDVVEQVIELKQKPGRNMIIFGSPGLTYSFMEQGLIDEYRINVNPVLLGSGVPLFKNIGDRINLKLSKAKIFSSGVVGLLYDRKKIEAIIHQ